MLPSADVFEDGISVTQSVTLRGDEFHQFLLQTEADRGGVSMVGLTGFGQKLFELRYAGEGLSVNKTPFLPDSLDPEDLFRDFQLIYWPGDLLRGLFADSAVEFQEASGGEGRRRLFRRAGKLVIDISYNPSPDFASDIIYRDHRRNYSIQIETLPSPR